ncbi:MAG: helix-turn-helix domain-containing protein [Lactimicrobium sp.]|uniref:winged helix-turn-helix transcriptional regulator n=1 Tax=Lactimicrobium sp. TaxID=2563780 RepID=UPI002F35CF28
MKKEVCEQNDRFGICPYVTAQKLLSGKWAILIMHALENGPRRFGELQKELGITQATLSVHLKDLEKEGLLTRTVYPQVPLRVEYSLTEIGETFKPVLASIETWGNAYIAFLHEKNAKQA